MVRAMRWALDCNPAKILIQINRRRSCSVAYGSDRVPARGCAGEAFEGLFALVPEPRPFASPARYLCSLRRL